MSVTTLFVGATVFDGTEFRFPGTAVLVDDGRIRVFDTAEQTGRLPDGTETVDLSGSTLVPGLIDAHVHLPADGAGSLDGVAEPFSTQFYRSVQSMRRTLDAGITTVRDAAGADLGTKRAVETGMVEGPRMRIAISLMSQTGGHGDTWLPSGMTMGGALGPHPGRPSGIADGVDEVRKTARMLLRAGADQIKICSTGGVLSPSDDPRHSQFTVDEIRTIVEEAETQGKYVMSHAQGTQGIVNAVTAGARSIEHGIYLDEPTIELMLASGTYLVPTLQAPLQVLRAADRGAALLPAMIEKARLVVERHRESAALAYRSGVPIVMGTDAGVGGHGTNLEEFELLEDLGMSTTEALRAGTRTAAELMRIADVGRIADGAVADLVVFDGDLAEAGLGGLQSRLRQVWQAGVRVR